MSNAGQVHENEEDAGQGLNERVGRPMGGGDGECLSIEKD
jgi:hypothetical protein